MAVHDIGHRIYRVRRSDGRFLWSQFGTWVDRASADAFTSHEAATLLCEQWWDFYRMKGTYSVEVVSEIDGTGGMGDAFDADV